MKLYITAILLLFYGLMPLASAQEKDYAANFEKGLQAYKKNEFMQAVKHFEASLASDMKSAQAYNNLGLAYYKSADLGRAILNFERALRLDPTNSQARKNLKAAKQYIDTNVKKHSGFWLFGAWESLALLMTSFSWTLIFYLLLFAGSGGLLLWYLQLDEKLSFVGLRSGIIFLSLSLLPFGFARTASIEQFDSSYAIITGVRAGVRTAPGLDGEDIMVLSSGIKAKIQEEMGDWYKIRLENGVVGWVPAKAIERI